jgi:hypothetical protein
MQAAARQFAAMFGTVWPRELRMAALSPTPKQRARLEAAGLLHTEAHEAARDAQLIGAAQSLRARRHAEVDRHARTDA